MDQNLANHDNDDEDNRDPITDDIPMTQVTSVRRSRAERARLEIERRHRSISRGAGGGDSGGAGQSRNVGTSERGIGNRNVGTNIAGGSSSSSTTNSTVHSHSNPSPLRARLEKYEKMGIRKVGSIRKDASSSSGVGMNPSTVSVGSEQQVTSQSQMMEPSRQSFFETQGKVGPGNLEMRSNKSGNNVVASNSNSGGRESMFPTTTAAAGDSSQGQYHQQGYSRQATTPRYSPSAPNFERPTMTPQQQNQRQQQSQPQPQKQQQPPQQKQQQQQLLQQQNMQRDKVRSISQPNTAQTKTQTSRLVQKPTLSNSKSASTTGSSAADNTSLKSGISFAMMENEINIESPLPPLVQRALGDRSYEKRKNAALEVEALVKSLADSAAINNNHSSTGKEHKMILSLIHLLAKDFCQSMNVHFRKGGLIGLAATAIGLMPQQLTAAYLEVLLSPVLMCFDDPEPRVRYYACESLYNIIKVARRSILPYFNMIFEGVATVLADTDDEVRDGAKLLDRLVKEIITECEEFSVEKFLPLLQNYIRRTNPYLRQLVVGWITVLDGIPDVCMIDYLPDFLDGLFNMLSDSNLEIRQAADSALNDFLREIRESAVLEFGPIVSILVYQCESKERLNRLTSVTWLSVLIHHPDSGGEKLLPFHAEVLGAILTCISDLEVEIRKVAERANSDLLGLLRDTKNDFELEVLLETLIKEMSQKDDVPTKVAVLKWVNMLLEKRKRDIDVYIDRLMPPLLQLLKDQSDSVVLLTVQVLSRISLPQIVPDGSISRDSPRDEAQFEMVIKSILALFNNDRNLLETRGSLIVRRLCVLLNAKSVYLVMADIISSYNVSPNSDDSFTLEFVATMVQTLNLILLTASELHNLRQLLQESFSRDTPADDTNATAVVSRSSSYRRGSGKYYAKNEGARVFASLFHCWSNNPVSTFSICLLARAYDLAFALVKKFSELEITVGFLMQIDKLVHLIESPIFVHTRLQLLDAEAPYHTYLLKSLYGLLMLLPQSDAFHALNDRLTSICNLRDNLGIRPSITASPSTGVIKNEESSIYESGLHALDLLDRFDEVMSLHRQERTAIQQKSILPKEKGHVVHTSRPGP